ncbi:hypothetical protein [Flavobacterium sp. CAU 1735]
MATTIKITPVIKGEESKRFNNVIAKSKVNKISETKKNRIFDLVCKVMSKKA